MRVWVCAAADPTLPGLDEPTNSISLDLPEAFGGVRGSGPRLSRLVLALSHTRTFSRQCDADTLDLRGGALIRCAMKE